MTNIPGRDGIKMVAIETHKNVVTAGSKKRCSVRLRSNYPTLLIQYIVNFRPVKQEQRSREGELLNEISS